jgi:hypothetical protein
MYYKLLNFPVNLNVPQSSSSYTAAARSAEIELRLRSPEAKEGHLEVSPLYFVFTAHETGGLSLDFATNFELEYIQVVPG